MIPE
jgi:hypothetical protein